MSFLRCDRDAFRQLAAEDFVFDFEVLHLPRQFLLSRSCDHQQKGVKYVRRGIAIEKRALERSESAVFAHRTVAFDA